MKRVADSGPAQIEFRCAFPNFLPPHTHFPTHAHYEHELVVIQQGRYRTCVGGKEYIAVHGDILFYPAGTVHEEWVEDDEPVLTWVCAFESSELGPEQAVYRRDTNGRVQAAVSRLHDLWYRNEDRGGAYIHFVPALRDLIDELKLAPSQDSNVMVDTVRAYIRSHLADTFTVKGLADVAGLSRTHFARQYRALTGRPPMEDVRFIRIEEASRLIATTQLPLHEIAPRVGIANAYHLSRLLKVQLGVGVKDLRR